MKRLFWILMPYYNKYYYPGNGIRWIIQDEQRKTPYCFCCGNYANGVAVVKIGKAEFQLPICKKHSRDYMDKHTDNPWELIFPCAIHINPKFTDQCQRKLSSSIRSANNTK